MLTDIFTKRDVWLDEEGWELYQEGLEMYEHESEESQPEIVPAHPEEHVAVSSGEVRTQPKRVLDVAALATAAAVAPETERLSTPTPSNHQGTIPQPLSDKH